MPRHSAGRYLIIAVLFAILAKIYDNSGKKRKAKTAQQKSWNAEEQTFSIQPQTANKEWHAEERAHHCKERMFWGWSIALYALTLGVTAAAAWFACSAYRQTKRQADIAYDALIASERPWIKSDIKISDFTISEYYASADIEFNVTNVGHTPASYVFPLYMIVFEKTPSEALKDQTAICDTNKLLPDLHLGQTVFPDQTFPYYLPHAMQRSEINNSVEHEGSIILHVYIVGCIDYRYFRSNEHHKTRFIYYLQSDRGFVEFDVTKNYNSRPIQIRPEISEAGGFDAD